MNNKENPKNNSVEEQAQKSETAKNEEQILAFWEENKIFKKSLEKEAPNGNFVFFDGPPFATGLPHYGHILAGTMKDIIPRYQTMKGKKVTRRWGWDCHGLPIENLIEGELGLKTKKDIYELGIEKFNQAARDSVLRYDTDWKKIVPRTGRWVDMSLSYKTMDTSYSETIWWIFKTIYDKGLIYEGHKAMHLCPRCETTLSNFEVNQGYKDIKDVSATVKFELVDEPGTFVLAWTTTPWTLPGNVALAVNPNIDYVKALVKNKNKNIFLISGKHACASDVYFPKLKKQLESEGYNVTIINHVDSSNPELSKNLEMLKDYDFTDSHVITHSLGASTFLKFLEMSDVFVSTLTMIAPTYPGKSFSSTNPEWVKNSGYVGFDVDFGVVKNKIKSKPTIIYSDESVIKEEHFVLLSDKLNASIYKEENKDHFFAKDYSNEPDHKIDFDEYFILAKELIEKTFAGSDYEIVEEFKGSDLIGKAYKPVFDYYAGDETLENKENGWKIYGADFVTTEDGTGVVHIAPAFGSDDMELGQKENLPFVQHVSVDGKFKPEVKDFAGLFVKPKDDAKSGQDHMATDIEIIKYLAHSGKLFAKEKMEHSYPHCWRCATPLLNYATSSWFLKVTDLKDRMVEVNKTINWVPENIKEGRFGKWLEGARDWAISRSRFWGAPLPVWKCQTGNSQFSISNSQKNGGCGNVEVVGSISDLKSKLEKKNNFFVIRHGEADNNVANTISTQTLNNHHLTEKGREQVKKSAEDLQEKNIDLIIASPFVRTTETAELVAEGLGIKKENILFDDRIREINLGELEGKNIQEYHTLYESQLEKFTKNPPKGENLTELKKRVAEFLYEINEKYSGKNILIVTHEYPYWMLKTVADALTDTQSVEWKEEAIVKNAEVRELDFRALPHNKNFEIDLHMPFVDDVKFACQCGGEMKRISEVFDCWFESGAMPYASNHYPFENIERFDPEKEIGFPADFIAEGQDQTRGWFYTSLVLSTALFNKSSYKNVIVNGMVMAEDGKKMSKSLKNYPAVTYILDKYGADAMRYYMINSPIVRAEDLNFSEKGVDEVLKKIILKVKNVYSFYDLYKTSEMVDFEKSPNVLDKWIVARLNQLNIEISKGLDNYELDRGARPIMDFVDDLSTWYVRRSRDRFKTTQMEADGTQINADKDFALATTRFVLQEFSKLIAPFMPFLAEELWQQLRSQNYAEQTQNDAEQTQDYAEKDLSVHLQGWPEIKAVDEKILEEMKKVREIVSLALEARAKVGIKVRQPLKKLTAYSLQFTELNTQLLEVVKDEVNVKEVVIEKGEEKVELDIEITPELKAEGDYRDLLRNIQGMRKTENLVPSDLVNLLIETSVEGKELVENFSNELKKTAGIKEIKFEKVEVEEVRVGDFVFKIKIER